MYEQGSQFQPSAIEMVDGQTSPPQLLTEADLIALMEKHGIGRVQTHTHTEEKCVFNTCGPKHSLILHYEHFRKYHLLNTVLICPQYTIVKNLTSIPLYIVLRHQYIL